MCSMTEGDFSADMDCRSRTSAGCSNFAQALCNMLREALCRVVGLRIEACLQQCCPVLVQPRPDELCRE